MARGIPRRAGRRPEADRVLLRVIEGRHRGGAQSEGELGATESRLQKILEYFEDAVLVIERRSREIQCASSAFETIWGRPRDAVYEGKGCLLQWAHDDDRARLEEAYVVFTKGDPFDEEYRLGRPDGGVRWVRARLFAIEEQEPARQDIALIEDVTGRKLLEEELRQSHKLESVGTFASGVAHDFNNVLQVVLGCLDLVRAEPEWTKDGRAYLTRAAEAARLGGELAGQLLAFAHGGQRTQAFPIELDQTIQRAAKMLERLVDQRIALKVKAGASGKQILAAPGQMEQILMNLVSNARDAMPDGGEVVVSTSVVDPRSSMPGSEPRPETQVQLRVGDSGCGMDPETAAHIFEPFFTTKGAGGTGLGLPTVASLVTQMGGSVDVSSTVGVGSDFVLTLPCLTDPTLRARSGHFV